jgi:hypothetical protein
MGSSVENPIRWLRRGNTFQEFPRQRKRHQANRCIIIAKPAEFGKRSFSRSASSLRHPVREMEIKLFLRWKTCSNTIV